MGKHAQEPRHKKWRAAVWKRDRNLCQMPECDRKCTRLNAHHIKTRDDFPHLRFNVSNGITLCETCHNKIRNREADYEATFTEIVAAKNRLAMQLLATMRSRCISG